ncbi:MAG: hypothetical protein H6844_15295 [Alphaproteobacteria bacterium]|nr:hypothetical protein [Alphaproteobacteria bacterium]
MKNMYEEEIEEANVCGKIKHVQKPYYHEMADVITRLMEPSTKLGKFDPDAEPVHKALREQLRIVVDQVMDELKDPVSQRADEACEDEPGADRSPPKA